MRLKHQHFNRIKEIIEHEDNDFQHIVSIGNLIRNFERQFGKGRLSYKLNQYKLLFLQSL